MLSDFFVEIAPNVGKSKIFHRTHDFQSNGKKNVFTRYRKKM